MSEGTSSSLLRHAGLRQLIKFCIVGASSTVIDKGGLWLLLKKITPTTPWWICATISFSLGVSNGFIWNRRWTFQAIGHAKASEQYLKFFLVNIVGLFLNLGFTKVFLIFMTGQVLPRGTNPEAIKVIIASLLATPIVVIWNFFANKHWTFRAPVPDVSTIIESIESA